MLLNLDNEIRQGNRGVINSLHIVKDDKLIYESYYNPVHSRNSNHVLNAITLSISSALVGTALEQGLINSIDDPISDYLPDYDDIFTLEPEKSAISINHLLTMRSGIAWNENIIPFSDPSSNLFQMTNSSDWVRYVLEQRTEAAPGLRYAFNSATAVVITKILENATGIPFEEYIDSFLFEPLNIQSAEWSFTPRGLPNTAWGLTLNPIDLTKIGYLYLNEGNWFGQQVITQSWVEASTDLQFQISTFIDFGRHWFRYSEFNSIQNVLSENDIYFANGFGSQYLYVIPHLNMVVSMTSDNFNNGHGFAGFVILRDFILPATL